MIQSMGRAMATAGAAGCVYALYLLAGKGWAILLGSFIVYVVGYHIMMNRRGVPRDLIAGEDLDASVLCRIGADGRVYMSGAQQNDARTQDRGMN
jgi:hypothetical protein